MSGDGFVTAFVTELRTDADRLEAYGAAGEAQAVRHVAEQLEARHRRWMLEELPITVAAEESGYSAERLRELVREGRIAAAAGDGPMRVRRCDLPRKAGPFLDDLDDIERRLTRAGRE